MFFQPNKKTKRGKDPEEVFSIDLIKKEAGK